MHWKYTKKPDLTKFGFVYCITNVKTKKAYIGCKQYFNYSKNKRSLRYYESYYQMKYNVLSSTLEGSDEPAYYNSFVGGKFYRPVEEYIDDTD